MKWTHNIKEFRDRRRELRKNQTEAEKVLWFELRNNKLGVKFKRQHSIGGYIADFYCQKYKLIIELDGEIHDQFNNKQNDAVRDKYFTELDYKILRFKNKELKDKLGETLDKIKKSCRTTSGNSNPIKD